MFEFQSRDEILSRMLASMADSLDKREGSVAWDMSAPAAVEFENFYAALTSLLNMAFADTASDIYLDLRASEAGIFRKAAIPSEGVIRVTGPTGTDIPVDSAFTTGDANPIYFLAKNAYTIPVDGFVDVDVIAEAGGAYTNVAAHSVIAAVGDLAALVTVDNASDILGGFDAESDEDLLDRYHDKVRQPVTSGNANQYLSWARGVSGVGDAIVEPLKYGNGTVGITLLGSDKLPPLSAVVTDAANYINSVKPIGATVTVSAATAVNINISASLVLASGVTIADVRPLIESAIVDYLKTLAFVDNTVRLSRIANAILDTVGVVDYTALTVNGGSGNVVVTTGQVAVLGVVTLA